MIRFASKELDRWLKGPDRNPLVMRGARQVGKTWLVRDFAERHGLELIELNLEKYPYYADLFSDNSPHEILKNIEAQLALKIHPESACLFLDEIQAAPELFAKLRCFREDMPELPVIAAGSLLEFALGKADFSMPVGRIAYFYLEPLSFFEFALALGHEPLNEKMFSATPQEPLPHPLHVRCGELYRQYCLIGGMPETVQTWLDGLTAGISSPASRFSTIFWPPTGMISINTVERSMPGFCTGFCSRLPGSLGTNSSTAGSIQILKSLLLKGRCCFFPRQRYVQRSLTPAAAAFPWARNRTISFSRL